MRFYRPLGQISALTFDLDDTLYDNRQVILRTEQESLAFVQSYHPALNGDTEQGFPEAAPVAAGDRAGHLPRRDRMASSRG